MADADWERLQESGKIRGRTLDLGTILPEGDDPRAVHAGARQTGGHFDWHVQYFTPPQSPPPDYVKQTSERLKGPVGFAALLESVTSFAAVGRVDFKISFRVSVDDYITVLFQERGPSIIYDFSPDALIEQVGYRFISAPLGIQEIAVIYQHNLKEYAVEVIALGTISLAIARSVPFAATIAVQVVERFFSKRI